MATTDPVRDLAGTLVSAPGAKHFAAITDPDKVGPLLRAIDSYQGRFIVRCALQIPPLVFQRPAELRNMRWDDIDLTATDWRFTLSKVATPPIVPLSRQVITILQELGPVTRGGELVFPGVRSKSRPISDNMLNGALRRIGYTTEEVSTHGYRAMAWTKLDEQLKYRLDIAEQQLGHRVKDALERLYNRTTFIDERRGMMQAWADYLESLKAEVGR